MISETSSERDPLPIYEGSLPEFWSRISWIAFPPSICLIWESDHVIRKSCRKVAGRPKTEEENATKHEKRANTTFRNVPMMGVIQK